MSSPERGAPRTPYEDPYYTQFLGPAAGRPNIAPVIDEETGLVAIVRYISRYLRYRTMLYKVRFITSIVPFSCPSY